MSTIGVIIGVYWEGDKFGKDKQHRGWLLLLCALAAETAFGIMIFLTDGWISEIQRHEIIALEKQIAPRKIDGSLFAKILRNGPKPTSKVQLLYVREDPDSYQLALQIYWYMGSSGWECDTEKPIPPPAADSMYGDAAIALSVGGHATGVTIVAPNIKDISWESPFGALFKAFRAALGQAGRGIDRTMPEDALRIVVAPKPLAPGTLPPDVPDMSDRIIER
jgi:hypothetical protein